MAFALDVLGKRALGAQYKLVSSGYLDYATVAANTAADDIAVVEIPANAIITLVTLTLETAFNGTTPALTTTIVSDDGDGTATDIETLDADFDLDSATALLNEALAVTSKQNTVPVYVTGAVNVIDSTAGRVRMDVEYYVVGRSNENEG